MALTGQRFRRVFKWLAPSWLTTGQGELVLFSLGALQDAFAERTRLGLLARLPSYANDDALNLLGKDRKIVRGINEPGTSYAPRLIRWIEDHKTRGNAFTLLEQLRAYLQTDTKVQTVDNNGNIYTIAADGTRTFARSTWYWDTMGVAGWSRFWVIIYPQAGSPWAPAPLLGTRGLLGSTGASLGGGMTQDNASQIKTIINAWKPAGTACWYVIVGNGTQTMPTPTGNWDRSINRDNANYSYFTVSSLAGAV